MDSIKAIIFDLDGVITDTAEYHYLAWKQLAESLGISFDREFNEKLKGIGRMESLELILDHSNQTYTQEEKEQMAARKNEYYRSLIQQITPDDLLPGVLNFIKDVKREGILTGLASASKNASFVIKQLGVDDLLDTVVDAAKVKKGKPDPEIFLTAARQLGIDPVNCVGVEDARAGIQAIKSAGMFAIGIGNQEILSAADWVVKTPAELSLKELYRRIHAS